MRRKILVLTAVSLTILLIILQSLAIFAQADTVEWILYVSPEHVYIQEPVSVFAFAFNPWNGTVFTVSCNITVVNEKGFFYFEKITGAPATTSLVFEENDTYTVYVACSVDKITRFLRRVITVSFPTPQVVFTAKWSRPLRVSITTPYPYNTVAYVEYWNANFTVVLGNGFGETILLPITRPEVVRVYFMNRVFTYIVAPTTPSLALVTTASRVFPGEVFQIRAVLLDDEGVLPVIHDVNLIVDQPFCVLLNISPFFTNIYYFIRAESDAPESTCTIYAETTLWTETTLSTSASVEIMHPRVVEKEFRVEKKTSWEHVVSATVSTERPVNGKLTLYLGDRVVSEDYGFKKRFTTSVFLNLTPGSYRVYGVFTYFDKVIHVGEDVIHTPRYPFTIKPPRQVYYAGEQIVVENADYYLFYVNESFVVISAVFRGNSTHEPASAVFTARVIHPSIVLTEEYFSVAHGAPGASFTVYCGVGGGELMIAEIKIPSSGNITEKIGGFLDCDYVRGVYVHRDYSRSMYVNEQDYVTVLTTTCYAGMPCLLMPVSPKVSSVIIGQYTYSPGESIKLPQGVYTMRVVMRDGSVNLHQVVVKPVYVRVEAYRYRNLWVVTVIAPKQIQVKVSFENTVLALGFGQYVFAQEPVSAYWEYGDVEFVKYKLYT